MIRLLCCWVNFFSFIISWINIVSKTKRWSFFSIRKILPEGVIYFQLFVLPCLLLFMLETISNNVVFYIRLLQQTPWMPYSRQIRRVTTRRHLKIVWSEFKIWFLWCWHCKTHFQMISRNTIVLCVAFAISKIILCVRHRTSLPSY